MVNEYSMTSIKALKSIGVDLSKLESQELINKNNIFNILVNFSNIMESQIKKVNKLGNNIGTRLNKSKTLQLLDAKFSKKVFNIPNFKSPSNENLLKFTMNELPKIVMSYKNENDVRQMLLLECLHTNFLILIKTIILTLITIFGLVIL